MLYYLAVWRIANERILAKKPYRELLSYALIVELLLFYSIFFFSVAFVLLEQYQ